MQVGAALAGAAFLTVCWAPQASPTEPSKLFRCLRPVPSSIPEGAHQSTLFVARLLCESGSRKGATLGCETGGAIDSGDWGLDICLLSGHICSCLEAGTPVGNLDSEVQATTAQSCDVLCIQRSAR